MTFNPYVIGFVFWRLFEVCQCVRVVWKTCFSGCVIGWKMSMTVSAELLGGETRAKRSRLSEEGAALRVKRLSEHAILPTRGSPRAAGYDLYRY